MIPEWRLFLTALRTFTRIPVPDLAAVEGQADRAARYMPLVGVVIGGIGGGAYWFAARLWPTSVAVALSMLATVFATGAIHEDGLAKFARSLGDASRAEARGPRRESPGLTYPVLAVVFVLLIKYNALMALSAANLGFSLPANLGLGVILIAAHTASRVLVLFGPAEAGLAARPMNAGELGFAVVSGFGAALLLGLPGLVGLAAAIGTRFLFMFAVKRALLRHRDDYAGAVQQLSEVCFYLGALAAWTYI
jgi:adenosylcobinamide-GDP ribazoletransferase